jgi:hypothetical protein
MDLIEYPTQFGVCYESWCSMSCSTAVTSWQGISDLDCIAYDLQSMGVLAMKSSGVNW